MAGSERLQNVLLMKSNRQFSITWFCVMMAIWAVFNLPTLGNAYFPIYTFAGYPFYFAWWDSNGLKWFSSSYLVADIIIGLLFAAVSGLLVVLAGRIRNRLLSAFRPKEEIQS
jgi:hypothetical protein